MESFLIQVLSNVINPVLRSLPLAFRGLAPKPPQQLRDLRGLGRLAGPPESSERFSEHLATSHQLINFVAAP